jgi:hypothetical protein
MWPKTKTILAALPVAGISFALTDVSSAKSAKSGKSVRGPTRSAPVYLDQGSHGQKWGDPGFYDGWVPPPARAGGVG